MSLCSEGARVPAVVLCVALALCLPVLVVPTGASPTSASHPQEATTVALDSASGPPGANVTVNLTVSGANVSSYQASITYDPDVVSVVAVTGVDFPDPVTNVESGRLNVTQVKVGGVEDPTLARITFELVGRPTNETALAFDEAATAVFDGNSNEIFVDSYSDGSVRIETPPTPTPTATATPTSTPAPTPASNGGGGDSGSGGATETTDGSDSDSDDGDSSLLGSVLDRSFLLGAGFVVLVLGVAGIGYYLGARRSGPRDDW